MCGGREGRSQLASLDKNVFTVRVVFSWTDPALGLLQAGRAPLENFLQGLLAGGRGGGERRGRGPLRTPSDSPEVPGRTEPRGGPGDRPGPVSGPASQTPGSCTGQLTTLDISTLYLWWWSPTWRREWKDLNWINSLCG